MVKSQVFLLFVIFFLGFVFRLYRLDNPPADWHAFRQSDTNAVSQRFVEEGINLLYPKYYDISNVQSGLDNTSGYRFVEFPIYNAVQASLYNVIGMLPIEQWGRLITIAASLATGLFIYLLTRKYAGQVAGVLSLIIYLFLPFSVFYGRVILPDPSMTAAIMGGIYFFDKWLASNLKLKTKNLKQILINRQSLFFILAAVFTSLALLLKPFAVFFTLPILWLVWNKYKFQMFGQWQLWLFAILTLAPFVAWRVWISQFPEGIPASAWLFNGNGIRGRPAFFNWIFYKRITELILGYFGVILAVVGLYRVLKVKKPGFFISFGLGALIYLFVIATGNVQHDYYQILIIPTIAMFAGIGTAYLFGILSDKKGRVIAGLLVGVLLVISFYYSWILVRDYFNINDRGMVAAGKKASEILPKDAVIIAPYDGSTTLLNISSRPGWPVFQVSIEELIDRGATYMVIANPTESDFDGFGQTYERIAESKDYLILKLTR